MNIWQNVRLVAPGLACVFIAGKGVLFLAESAHGQIIPDNTLGTESSVVNSGELIDLIEGGATRGSGLFHSFEDFNVNAGQQVYFANPVGIENILSRVTGLNPSEINGLMGVEGAANLFFLNPNGIVFGPDAHLDVDGSFVASTSDRFQFADGTEFRATNPNDAPLVTVNIPLGLQLAPETGTPAPLFSNADLTTGRDLTLSAGTVTSTGMLSAPNGEVRVEGVSGDVQVQAVTAQSAELSASENLILEESRLLTQGNLSLLAGQTVRIRDSEEAAFLAAAGGVLRIQGKAEIDILALNHLEITPFQSGGDMVLISNGTVSGDAHFTSFGGFSILDLEGNPGYFVSYYDPIISSTQDVIFGDYTGVALKVEAIGSIIGGNIVITGPDTTFVSAPPGSEIEPDNPTSDTGILGLSSALILRSGLANLENPPVLIDTLACSAAISCSATSAQNSIEVQPPASATNPLPLFENGNGLLIPTGSIQVNSIDTRPNGRGPVLLRSYATNGRIAVMGVTLSANSTLSLLASDVTILTEGEVNVLGGISARQDSADTAGEIRIGDDDLGARPSNITVGRISTRNGDSGAGGNVEINTRGIFEVTGGFDRDGGTGTTIDSTLAYNESLHAGYAGIATQANGDGGEINITADGGVIVPAEIVSASAPVSPSTTATGSGGEINIRSANGSIEVGNVRSFGEIGGGDACISAGISSGSCNTFEGVIPDNLELSLAAAGSTFVSVDSVESRVNNATDSAGRVLLEARDQLITGSINSQSNGGTGFDTSGDIDIISHQEGIEIIPGASISSLTVNGDAGDIRLRADGQIRIDASGEEAISISSSSFSSDNSTATNGNSDVIKIESNDSVMLRNVSLATTTRGPFINPEDIGDVIINAPIIEITDDSRITTETFNSGLGDGQTGNNSGAVQIGANADEFANIILLDNVEIKTDSHGLHDSGQTPGDAGSITIGNEQYNQVVIQGGSTIRAETHSHLVLSRNADPTETTFTEYLPASEISYEAGLGGSVEVLGQTVAITGSDTRISTTTYGDKAGGDITIDGQSVTINEARIISETSGATADATGGNVLIGIQADAITGNPITVFADNVITLNGANISTTTGRTQLPTHFQNLDDPNHPDFDPTLPAFTLGASDGLDPEFGLADAGNIVIGNSQTDTLSVIGNSLVEATSEGEVIDSELVNVEAFDLGMAGTIIITASDDDLATVGDDNPATLDGDIIITDSLISSRVVDADIAGDISITGATVNVTDAAISSDNPGDVSSGTAGSIEVGTTGNTDAAPELNVTGSRITATTSGKADAGQVSITAYNSGDITIANDSNVSSSTFGLGDSKPVTLSGQNIEILGGSRVQALSQGMGAPGSIEVDAFQSLQISGFDTLSQVSELSTISGPMTDLSGNTAELCAVGCIEVQTGTLTLADGGRINAVTGTSNPIQLGGSIDIDAQSIGIITGGQILTSSIAATGAQAGNIQIEAKANITISDLAAAPDEMLSSGIFAESNGANSGFVDIDFTGPNSNLVLQEGAQISTSTMSGEGSDVSVTGLQTLTIENALISTSTETGTAGGIIIDAAGSAALSGEGGISASAGNTEMDGGTGGNIEITTQQLSTENGAAIAASGTGTGTAGSVTVNADTVKVANGGQILATTEAGIGNPDGIRLQNLQSLTVDEGLVSTSTATGSAGDITVVATDSILLSGQLDNDSAGVSAAASNGGVAGSVTLNTRDFRVQEGAAVTVSSPSGEAGSLNVTATEVNLDQGSLTAVAGTGAGNANIAIDLSQDPGLENFIRLQNESLISANAQGDASGGNIAINADFIFADYPTGDSGSDIVANAQLGDGGIITIDAPLGVFGLEFRPELTPLNDITANSDEGLEGIVDINTLATDADSGLAELAFEFIDASDQTTNQCVVDSGEASEVRVAGRSGLPTMPTDVLSAIAPSDEDWVTLETAPKPVPEDAMQSTLTEDAAFAAGGESDRPQALCHRAYRATQERL